MLTVAIRKIVTLGHPVLRQRAAEVTRVDDSIRTLMDDMLETMHAAPGIGLAAPQVAESVRVIVVSYDDHEFALANPRIVKHGKETETDVEACLSLPRIQGLVCRPLAVTVTGIDRDGGSVTLDIEDWLARCVQHEIDHLDGTVFLDRVTDPKVKVYHDTGEVDEDGDPIMESELVPVREVFRLFEEEYRQAVREPIAVG